MKSKKKEKKENKDFVRWRSLRFLFNHWTQLKLVFSCVGFDRLLSQAKVSVDIDCERVESQIPALIWNEETEKCQNRRMK